MITSINEFSTYQQQVLQLLVTQPEYVATPATLMGKIGGSTGESIRAIWELMRTGHIGQVQQEDSLVQLRLSDDMIRLLSATAEQENFFDK